MRPGTDPARGSIAVAVRLVLDHWGVWLRGAVLLQVVVGLVVAPIIALLLRAALRAAGVGALTEASFGQVVRHPVALLLLLLLATVATAAVLVQHAVFVLMARDLCAGRVPTPRALAAEATRRVRGLTGPGLALVALYSFVLAPLGGFTLGASLTRAIELPPFIAGELQKTPLGAALWLALMLVLLYLNLRWVLVPTLLLTSGQSPGVAFRRSWHLTRRRLGVLTTLALGLWAAGAILVTGLVVAAVGVTRFADVVWPAAAPAVAGLALTLAQVALLALGGLATALVSAYLFTIVHPTAASTVVEAPTTFPVSRVAVVAGVAVLMLGTVGNAAALRSPAAEIRTAVIAHRGATYGAVENTLESLEAAAELGADVVELDVLQAGDGGLVVVHDTNLRRIAGLNRDVSSMTTAELTATTVRQGGHTGVIPTFDAFAARAADLGVALLVEVKQHGSERGDVLGDVVEILERHGLVESSMVQTFDRDAVAELESRFPEVSSGWVVAFSRGRPDFGAADFITMEQASYSPAVLRRAHAAGVRVLLWTVTDELRMRSFVREGVDGLITGYPQRALAQRTVVESERGVADRLEDTLRALAGW